MVGRFGEGQNGAVHTLLHGSLRRATLTAAFVGTLGLARGQAPAAPAVLADNGAWCWFQDERAIVDTACPGGPLVLFSAVAFAEQGDARHGDIDVHWWRPGDGTVGAFELHDRLQPDDHDAAALWIRPDGRYLAVYTKHSADKLVRWRVSEQPHDPSAWRPEQTFTHEVRVCYSNLFLLDDEHGKPRLVDFARADGYDPNWFVSDDDGTSWRYGGKLHTGPGGNDQTSQRPYVKYAARGTGELHFVTTDGHPRDEDNSVYHGVLRRGVLYGSAGVRLGALSTQRTSELRSPAFTTVFATGTQFGGTALRHAWTVDLHVDGEGRPYAALSARADAQGEDHRFLYARWTGERWDTVELCRAGGHLYEAENDYTGLVALHPLDPNVLFVSTPVDPRDGARLRHYELFFGRTGDAGASWAWTPVTWASDVDNLRPIVPIWDAGHTALLWLRGAIRTYTDWTAEVVGRVVATSELASLGVAGQATVTRPAVQADR